MHKSISRRHFLLNSALTGSILPFIPSEVSSSTPSKIADKPKIHIFSKHLQFLNFRDMAEAAKEMGFDGIDLTIRPKGHVLPEKVESDLPMAVEAMKNFGFSPSLFCTAVENADNPLDKKLLETAANLGFKYYRMNWYKYTDQKTIPESLAEFREKMTALSHLNKQLDLIGCYQNHAGRMVGASMFEIWDLLQKSDLKHMGAQYDIRHATVEGGLSWQTGLNLIKPHIKTIVLKDTIWENKNGKITLHNVPLGEGMVDWSTYLKFIKQNNIQVPICLHLEYPLGGADQGAEKITIDKKLVFNAMKRDLAKARELWEKA